MSSHRRSNAAQHGSEALSGPLPADTLFTPPVLSRGDAVLAMFHDQGLAALKYATFGHGINVTLWATDHPDFGGPRDCSRSWQGHRPRRSRQPFRGGGGKPARMAARR